MTGSRSDGCNRLVDARTSTVLRSRSSTTCAVAATPCKAGIMHARDYWQETRSCLQRLRYGKLVRSKKIENVFGWRHSLNDGIMRATLTDLRSRRYEQRYAFVLRGSRCARLHLREGPILCNADMHTQIFRSDQWQRRVREPMSLLHFMNSANNSTVLFCCVLLSARLVDFLYLFLTSGQNFVEIVLCNSMRRKTHGRKSFFWTAATSMSATNWCLRQLPRQVRPLQLSLTDRCRSSGGHSQKRCFVLFLLPTLPVPRQPLLSCSGLPPVWRFDRTSGLRARRRRV